MKIRVLADDEPSVTLESLTTPGTGIVQEDGTVTRTWEQVDLLLATERDVFDRGSLWKQRVYVDGIPAFASGYCETAGCVAGHALARADIPVRAINAVVWPGVVTNGGRHSCFSVVGRTILGLSDEEAAHLFLWRNNAEDIRRNVADIVARTRYV